MKDDLAIDRRLENGAAVFKLIPESRRIDEVAVMGHSDLTSRRIDAQGLRVQESA